MTLLLTLLHVTLLLLLLQLTLPLLRLCLLRLPLSRVAPEQVTRAAPFSSLTPCEEQQV
jgi:hypothetical protein